MATPDQRGTQPPPPDYVHTPGSQHERRPHIPADASLADLWHSFPAKFTKQFAGLLAIVFGLGLAFGEFGYVSKFLHWGVGDSEQATVADRGVGDSGQATVADRPSHPVATSDDADRATLRQKHAVTLIDRLQNQLDISRIPGARYGFISPYFLRGYKPEDQLPVFQQSDGPYLEFHKLLDGRVLFLGYLTPLDAIKVSDPSLSKYSVTLFTHRQADTSLAAVDFSKATVESVRELPNFGGHLIELKLAR